MGRHEALTERWRSGIALRLYALALVPILFVLVGAGLVIRQAGQQAREATLVGKSIPELAARQSLLVALLQEAGATEVDMRAGALNSTLRKMIESIGSLQSVPAAQANVDHALVELGSRDPGLAGRYGKDVVAARAFAKSAGTTAEMSSWRYAALQRQVLTDLINSNNDMISKIAGLSSYSGVSSSLQTLNTLGTALINRENAFDTLGGFILGSAQPRTELVANLARATGLYQQASLELMHATDRQVAATWSAMVNDPDTRALDNLFNQLMTRDNVDPAVLLKSSMVETQASTLLVKTTLNVGSQEQTKLASLSTSVRASAISTLRTTCLGALLILAASFLFALRVTRSIRNPLSDLERGARSANSGEAEIEAIEARGPRETRTVISSFNDLLANLRLVEAKSQALAALDLTNPALDARLPGRIGVALDASMRALRQSVSERTKLAEQLAHDAEHDALTGLANRQRALTWLGDSVNAHCQDGGRLAVLFIDLDGFKLVNDTHGHRIGDQLLVKVAGLLTEVVGAAGLVARLGGDEFLVLAKGQDVPSALALGKRVVQTLGQTVQLGPVSATIGASVGIALAGDHEGHPVELIAQADLALYRAKQDGRGRVHLFDRSMQRDAGDRADLAAALRATLDRGGDELQLRYQNIVNGEGRTQVVEALARWSRPGLGLLLPAEFMPVAEESDLVLEVDRWILSSALQQAAAWRTDPQTAELIVSINVSGRHLLSGQLPANVAHALAVSGMSPRFLMLEISESVLPADPQAAVEQLALLRATGVRIALDGFGTGSTSVATLRALPLDVLKIDPSLVEQAADPAGRDLLGFLSNVGHVLGRTVIAAGVDTAEQCDAARGNGADLIQGAVISGPVPAAQLTAALAANPTFSGAPNWLAQRQPDEPDVASISQD